MMGTGKAGNLDDYSSNIVGKGKKGKEEIDQDKCDQALSAKLEEVERSAYFIQHKAAPLKGTQVALTLNKRLVVEVDGLTLGFLPTRFNYLVPCIKKGYAYSGFVSSVTDSPLLTIHVDLAPM